MVKIGDSQPRSDHSDSVLSGNPRESRVRSRIKGLSDELASIKLAKHRDTPVALANPELRGKLYEHYVEQESQRCFVQVQQYIQKAKSQGITLSQLMGGDGSEVHRYQSIALHEANQELKNRYGIMFRREKYSLARQAHNPSYIEAASSDEPNLARAWRRTKFYLSLNGEVAPDMAEHQKNFLVELAMTAVERGIYLSWKTMDHSYDSPDIYTDSPKELGDIITVLYAKYPPEIWRAVPRIFQGKLEGVSPEHIGVVQEPEKGYDGSSHSVRMAYLGEAIEAFGDHLTYEQYRRACQSVGVRPEAPWRLTAEAEARYCAKRQREG